MHYVAFSALRDLGPGRVPAGRAAAARWLEATGCLGIKPDRVQVLDFEVREFGRDRQQILQTMVDLNRELAPGLVLLPSPDDLHQDHSVIGIEGLRAFKRTSVLAYEIAWNNLSFRTSSFVAVEERHLAGQDRRAEVLPVAGRSAVRGSGLPARPAALPRRAGRA